MAFNLLLYIIVCSFIQVDLSCHRFVSELATSPSGAMVSTSRMRFCQVDDTRRTLLAVHCPKVSREDRVVALTAQTIWSAPAFSVACPRRRSNRFQPFRSAVPIET